MTYLKITYKQHTEIKQFINYVQNKIRTDYKDFILDFVSLKADLQNIDIPNIYKLPAIKWKMQNLEKLKNINPEKFRKEYQELKRIFD